MLEFGHCTSLVLLRSVYGYFISVLVVRETGAVAPFAAQASTDDDMRCLTPAEAKWVPLTEPATLSW